MNSISISEPCGLMLSEVESGDEVLDRVSKVEETLVDKLDKIDFDRVCVVVGCNSCVFVRNKRSGGFVWVSISNDDSEPLSNCPMFELRELV